MGEEKTCPIYKRYFLKSNKEGERAGMRIFVYFALFGKERVSSKSGHAP